MSKPIQLKNVSLSFPHKVCFEDFTVSVAPGSRIAIMGRNGSGKSTLLRLLCGEIPCDEGVIKIPEESVVGYVPQVIDDFEGLSGGQRLNESLTQALSLHPDVLLLDEPTNHLDAKNRKSLMRLLKTFNGTLIVVSHDVALLRLVNTLWHIDNGRIHVFSGSYDDYVEEKERQNLSLQEDLVQLERQKKQSHQDLMKEQERAKSSKAKGEKSIDQRKWPTVVSQAKARRAQETSGRKSSEIQGKKQEVLDQLADRRLPKPLSPKFSINAADIKDRVIVTISEGSVGYEKPFLENIHIVLKGGERLAITGDNASGKSTIVRAILEDPRVVRSGVWLAPKGDDIGYLDQHYKTLDSKKTVLETIQDIMPQWSHAELRSHLNDFMFRKNEEVNAFVSTLSGGEKVRLSLAQIAAKTPKLLILDEITNNLDLETCAYIVQILKDYPGALIVISHDENFLEKIDVRHFFPL